MNFITGGAGFIGSHLVERIGETVYDNLSVNNAVMPKCSLFWPGDLLDLDGLKETMAGHDIVWHLGASSDIAVGNKVTDTDLKPAIFNCCRYYMAELAQNQDRGSPKSS